MPPRASAVLLHQSQPSVRHVELHGGKWPECCGFVVLRGLQKDWLILKHQAFDIVPAELGFKTTDQTWHYEQWQHQTCARRKRRRDASPAESPDVAGNLLLRSE